jgi:myosin heavy subunit
MVGANINHYLLEKACYWNLYAIINVHSTIKQSRVVTQGETERNYHVFYELLSGATKEMQGKNICIVSFVYISFFRTISS